jgi:hypothetical protein
VDPAARSKTHSYHIRLVWNYIYTCFQDSASPRQWYRRLARSILIIKGVGLDVNPRQTMPSSLDPTFMCNSGLSSPEAVTSKALLGISHKWRIGFFTSKDEFEAEYISESYFLCFAPQTRSHRHFFQHQIKTYYQLFSLSRFPFLNYPTIILNFQATQLLNLRHAFKDTHNLYQVSRWFCQHPRTVLRPLSVYSSNTTATTTSHTSVETPGTSDCKLCFSKCRPQGGDRLHPRTGEERGVSSQWIFD